MSGLPDMRHSLRAPEVRARGTPGRRAPRSPVHERWKVHRGIHHATPATRRSARGVLPGLTFALRREQDLYPPLVPRPLRGETDASPVSAARLTSQARKATASRPAFDDAGLTPLTMGRDRRIKFLDFGRTKAAILM